MNEVKLSPTRFRTIAQPDADPTPLTIREIVSGDRERWEPLWRGYLDFYQKTVPRDVTDWTWTRLITTHEIEGLVAINGEDEVVGLAHFFHHPSSSSIGGYIYLQDLFIIPEARNQRIGRRLIAAVEYRARDRGAAALYWHTEEFNGPARRLYERVAKRSPFIRYQIDL
jgi:GNAT superfamily N-acetyltransferase